MKSVSNKKELYQAIDEFATDNGMTKKETRLMKAMMNAITKKLNYIYHVGKHKGLTKEEITNNQLHFIENIECILRTIKPRLADLFWRLICD